MTILDLLARAEGASDTGLRLLDRDLTPQFLPWPVIAERARRTGAWLRESGLRASDHVGLIFGTRAAFFDAFFGVLLAGGVPVPLYPPVRLGRFDEYRERTAAMLKAARTCLLLTERRVHRLLGEVALECRPRLGCRLLPDAAQLPASTEEFHSAEPPPHALALIQFSSGTTRAPRPVALTHRALVAQAALLNGYWPDIEVRHSGVSWLPLYHDMGLIGCVLTALERAATVTLIPPELFVARPAVWLKTISQYRATVSPAPNFAYSLALQRIADAELVGVDLSCWRIALCGAESVVPDVMRAFQARFARWGFAPEAITPVYGLSEAALAVTFTSPSRVFVSQRFDRGHLRAGDAARIDAKGREIVSVGRPVAGFAVRVTDERGQVLPDGGIGMVECRGPSVMDGYLDQPAATAEVLCDGWLRTGDLGFIWQDELYLTGRGKDSLIIRGANLAPEEIERAAQTTDGVRAGCAVAVSTLPEGADGEQLLVFVEARRDVSPHRHRALADRCAASILSACGVAPRAVVVLPAGTLPRTSSGKLRRQDTLARYEAGDLVPPSAVTPLRLAGWLTRSTAAHLRRRVREAWRGFPSGNPFRRS